MDLIFTTLGMLPVDQIDFRETVTHDDGRIRLVRVDKYLKDTGAWVGNDIRGEVKTGIDIGLAQAAL